MQPLHNRSQKLSRNKFWSPRDFPRNSNLKFPSILEFPQGITGRWESIMSLWQQLENSFFHLHVKIRVFLFLDLSSDWFKDRQIKKFSKIKHFQGLHFVLINQIEALHQFQGHHSLSGCNVNPVSLRKLTNSDGHNSLE